MTIAVLKDSLWVHRGNVNLIETRKFVGATVRDHTSHEIRPATYWMILHVQMSNGYSVIGALLSIPRAKPEASKENMPTEVRLHNAEAGDGVGEPPEAA